MAKSSVKSKRTAVVALEGKPQSIHINKLEFDPENPRTVERLGRKASQGQIEEFFLGGEMKARDLVPSFITNGYIPYEPLIVKTRKPSGNFVVVEGNRRLAALRWMKNSTDAEEKSAFAEHELSLIPCLIFEGDERQLL